MRIRGVIHLSTELMPGGSVVKRMPANARDAGDMGLIPGSGRSPGEGNGNLLQYYCVENPMDIGAWEAIVHRVAKSRTSLSMHEKIMPNSIPRRSCI